MSLAASARSNVSRALTSLELRRHGGVAEVESGRLHRRDEIGVRGVELDLPVEDADRLVDMGGVAGAEVVERGEGVREQPGDQGQDAGLHVIHVRPVAEPDPVILGPVFGWGPGELRERLPHLLAVVGLTLVPGDPDLAALDGDAVAHSGEDTGDLVHVVGEVGERRRLGIALQVVAERDEAARAELDRGERIGQRADRPAVDACRIEEPAFLLVLVAELLCLGQVLAHLAHPRREVRHRRAERLVLQVPLYLMPVPHRRRVGQRGPEVRREVVLVPSGGHRGEDLVEVEVAEQRGILALGRRGRPKRML